MLKCSTKQAPKQVIKLPIAFVQSDDLHKDGKTLPEAVVEINQIL
jgi:hypothetical protein